MFDKRSLSAVILCLQLSFPFPALAEPSSASGTAATNLDLSSTSRNVTAGSYTDFTSVDIKVGDSVRTVTASDLLTPAELVAVQQVLSTGAQSLQLGQLGNAVGGTVHLNQHLGANPANLVVPRGVTTIFDAAQVASLNLAGDLANSGTFYAVSSSPQVTTASIAATNIINGADALLSTIVPSSILNSMASAVKDLNLSLHAIENIINHGTISSAGNLTATAGRSIINSLPAGATGASPVMQALGAVNLQTNNLVNSGIISSASTNINVIAQSVADLVINNIGGRLEAINGSINIRDSLFSGKANAILSGGDLLARELNVYSGTGSALIDVQNLAGLVNIFAHEAYVTASTETLNLGTIELGGDPAFFNTAGNVAISSNMIFPGQDLSIVASGDVSTTVSGLRIDTSSSSGNGGKILIVAGANVAQNGSVLEITAGTGSGGGSATGGKIDLGTLPLASFSSRGGLSSGTGNGGNVTLVAYAGSNPSSGTIRLPSSTALATGGRGTGTNGNVTLIAGAPSGTANSVTFSTVNTTGGLNGTGNIYVATATPAITGGTMTIDATTGAVLSGQFVAGPYQPGSIVSSSISSPGSELTFIAGANATFGSISNAGAGNLPGSNGGLISVLTNAATDTGAQFVVGGPTGCSNCTTSSFTSTSNTTGLNGSGGTISISNAGTGGIRVANLGLLSVALFTLNGNGGKLILDAAAGPVAGPLNLAGGTMSANAAGNGNGGQLVLRGSTLVSPGGSPWTFSARGSTSGSGNGGTVSITTTSGDITFGSAAGQIASVNVSSGTSGGNGGSVLLAAGQNLSVNTASITAGPLGTTGNGATFNLSAGTAGSGLTNINGTLSANGTGSGNGGSITIAYNDPTDPFVVGGTVSRSGITGSLSANAPGAGQGGTVSLTNIAAAPLSVALGGTISAASASGPAGTIKLTKNTQAVSITGPGSLSGKVFAAGSDVTIDLQAPSSNLVLQSATATGNISLAAGNITNTGTVQAGANLVVAAPNLSNSGSISAGTSASVTTSAFTNTGALSAGSLDMSSTGNLAVSGGGSISSTGSLSFSSASGSLDVSQGSISGMVSAGGSSVAISTTSGDLVLGAVASSSGDVSLTASGGNLNVTEDVTASGGNLQLSCGSQDTNSVTVSAGKTASGLSTNVAAPQLVNYGNVVASNGDLSLQSNAANAALAVALGQGSSLSAAGNGSRVKLNPTTGGAVSVSGGANGSVVSAPGEIQVNGGSGSVSMDVDTLAGSLSASGASISVTTASGDLVVSSASGQTGDVVLTATNGGMVLSGSASAGGAISLNAGAGDVVLSGSATAGGAVVLTSSNANLLLSGNAVAGTAIMLNAGGSITMSGSTSAAGSLRLSTGSAGSVSVAAGAAASGSQVDVSTSALSCDGQLSATSGSLTVQSNAGDGTLSVQVGPAGQLSAGGQGAAISLVAPASLSVTGAGQLAAPSISLVSNGGSVFASTGSLSGVVGGSAETGFSVSVAAGGLTAGNIAVANGSLVVAAGSGPLSVAAGATLTVNEGTVTLQNNDTVAGSIAVGDGALLAASTTGESLGRIFVVIGPVPSTPVAGTAPADLAVNLTNGGQVYFGQNSISVACCGSAANVDGSTIVFDTGGLPGQAISVGSGVTFSAQSAPPPPPPPPPPLPPGHGCTPPGHGGTPPGHGGTPPGHSGTPPGLGSSPPGQGGTPPGQCKKDKTARADREESSDLVLVSYIHPTAPMGSAPVLVASAGTDSAQLKLAPDTIIFSSKSGFVLNSGEVLVSPVKPVVVRAGAWEIYAAPGTMALIERSDETLKVRNAFEKSSGGITIVLPGKHKLVLSAGQEAMMSLNRSSLSRTCAGDAVGRRRLRHTVLDDGTVVQTSEVSLTSLIGRSGLLRGVAGSNHDIDRAIVARLMRMAACLMLATPSHGPYASGGR